MVLGPLFRVGRRSDVMGIQLKRACPGVVPRSSCRCTEGREHESHLPSGASRTGCSPVRSVGGRGLLKLKGKCESIEADRVRSSGSEKVADVGT